MQSRGCLIHRHLGSISGQSGRSGVSPYWSRIQLIASTKSAVPPKYSICVRSQQLTSFEILGREWARSPKAFRIGESLRVCVPNPDAVFNPTDRALSRETPRARESSLKTGIVCNTSPKTHLPRAVTHGECVNQRASVFQGVSQGSPDETRTMTLWLTAAGFGGRSTTARRFPESRIDAAADPADSSRRASARVVDC